MADARGPSGRRGPEAAGAVYDDGAATLPRERFLEIQVDRAGLYERTAPSLDERARRAAGYLRQMQDLARRGGAGLLVALIPDEIQVDPGLLAEVARARGRTPADFDLGRPSRAIAAALDQAGVPYVWTCCRPSWRRRRASATSRRTHWNLAGNRLAAAVLAPIVSARLHRGPAAVPE
ncbi:MAG: hypothetical protein R2708_27855 [Vicinamibacterales bacterium]